MWGLGRMLIGEWVKINEGDWFWVGLSFVWVILYLWDGLLVSDKEIIVERVYSISLECMYV